MRKWQNRGGGCEKDSGLKGKRLDHVSVTKKGRDTLKKKKTKKEKKKGVKKRVPYSLHYSEKQKRGNSEKPHTDKKNGGKKKRRLKKGERKRN